MINVPPDLTQEDHIGGLPIGTRGGIRVLLTRDGKYDIQVRLAKQDWKTAVNRVILERNL